MFGAYVFADDSGSFSDRRSPYISFCGYVGASSDVGASSKEWDDCRTKWEVPPIHMSPIMNPQYRLEWQKVCDEWGAEWEEKRDEMLAEFTGIIARSALHCVCAVVDAAHYRAMPECGLKMRFKDPYDLAFAQVVKCAIRKTEIIESLAPISVIVDDGQDTSIRYYKLLASLKKVDEAVKNRVRSICFVNDGEYPLIQASDMIAWEYRRLMEARLSDPLTEASERFRKLRGSDVRAADLYTPERLDRLAQEPPSGSTP